MMPLMAVSLLASCGGGNKIPELPEDLDLYKKRIRYEENGETILSYTTYEYDGNLKVKEEDFDAGGTKYNIFEYAYDELGNIKEKNVLNGSIGGNDCFHTYDNTYDDQNRLTKVVHKYTYDKIEWYIDSIDEYIYENHITTHKLYGSDEMLSQTITYTYDKNGCLINIKNYIYEPYEGIETVVTVNKYGCATLSEVYSLSEDGVRGEKIGEINVTYLSNLWYRPLKSAQIPVDSSMNKMITEYGYNDNKQIISEKYYEENAQSPFIYYYTYEY